MVACEHDDFELVEMASGVKQAVGFKVRGCQVELGVCTTKLDAYVTNLGTYDLIIGMDWLEDHRDFMDCYAMKVLCLDDDSQAIQNHQAKHQATIVESIGNVNNFKLKILFYLGATDSFISPYALEKCGFDAYKHNDFELVEMDSGVKRTRC